MPKPPVKFPLNVNLESIDGTIERAKIVNGFAELASAQEVRVHKRPALTLAQGSFAAFGQGMSYTPDGQLFVISGGDIYNPVGGVSASGTGTHSAGGSLEVLFRPYGNYLYAISKGTNGVVWRAASPYTSFGSLGTHGGAALADAIWHSGTLFAIDASGTAGMRKSATGTSWSAPANIPSGAMARLFTINGTLQAYPVALTSGIDYYYTTNGGATAWAVGTITNSGVALRDWITGFHNSKNWAASGTGVDDVLYTSDGSTWLTTNVTPGWTAMAAIGLGSTFASLNGVMYIAVYTAAPAYEIYASSNLGVTWTKIATISVASTDDLLQLFTIGSTLYAALSNSAEVYTIYKLSSDGTLANIAALTNISVPADEVTSILGTESGTTFVKTTLAAYTISSGTVTQVTDAQYPTTTVPGAVYLNGRLYVMESDGTIWNSAEDDFTSWAGTDFINAEFEADKGVRLAKQGEYVVAFGQFTTEAFYDAGNATGSPLAPVSNAVLLIGCAHANSVAQVESALVWVAQQKGQGSTFNKGRFVVVMKGYGAYERISTPDVERVLDADDFSGVFADILTISGHVFYVISLLDSDITLVYDFKAQLWYEWSLSTADTATSITGLTQSGGTATAVSVHGRSDGDQVVVSGVTPSGYNGTLNVNVVNSGTFTYPVSSALTGTGTGASMTAQGWSSGALDISASVYFNNEQLVQLRTTGDVYVLDVTGTSDNGAPIDWRIRFRQWDGGSNSEKFMGACEVVGQKVSTTALLRYSDDDYGTWTKFRRLDLSLRRPRARRGGSFSRRAVEFRQTLSARVSITSIEAEIEQGTG